ncbi:hypothetical protein SAMN05421807_104228 [Virgibacillus chiguensis]|uniref:Uncharacterized protein n=1 Tax=Virgibacillus chiguensis TaxID=411959 RepID=A0A1M5QR83_9BACI|nr:hypothetical protein SAMN05421807_104228 [Virgibacillus chiguensis]
MSAAVIKNRVISIHAPIQGATYETNKSRRGRWISIHAPIQGATYFTLTDKSELFISIHAPIQGAKIMDARKFVNKTYFNPRTYTRCDLRIQEAVSLTEISIHAPIQGATILSA